jgi:stringent starvation protein B
MPEKSTKPYLIRAIHEWCADSGYTPYLSVKVDENTRVPMEFVKNGEIVLNLSYDATHKLTIDHDGVRFAARFSGVSRECSVPVSAITGIFARENGQGLFFAPENENAVAQPMPPAKSSEPESPTPPPTRPKLQIVK